MLDWCVHVCDSREDAVEQRGEQVVVFDDIIGKYGDGRVHWSKGWVSARRRASSCLACVGLRCCESAGEPQHATVRICRVVSDAMPEATSISIPTITKPLSCFQ